MKKILTIAFIFFGKIDAEESDAYFYHFLSGEGCHD